ncbi:MAG: TylF/MycF/NovP-related O-methyltransferase, partial [Gammaproteobacteria bacterium]
FGRFPDTEFTPDQPYRQRHIDVCGDESISEDQLKEVLVRKNLNEGVDLIKGDIMDTLPDYLKRHPQARFSLINLDVDIFEPSKLILEECFPRLVKGGVLLMDDYGKFPGETKAVDDYFSGTTYELQRLPFSDTPTFIIK